MAVAAKVYSSSFYRRQRDGSRISAEVVLSLLFQHVKPRSVLDYGCGVGTWLAAAGQLGAERLVGYEGKWVTHEMLADRSIELHNIDLEREAAPQRRVDLAICLEVAEHVSDEAGRRLVSSLCKSSDLVLFGAAIPGQGGRHHVNEQWQSHWVDAFFSNSFNAYDVIRPAVWSDGRVELWYAQNALVYAKRDNAALHSAFAKFPVAIAALVHPRLLLKKLEHPSLKDELRTISKLPEALLKGLQLLR
jgi:SAM-dependent methyltransferase